MAAKEEAESFIKLKLYSSWRGWQLTQVGTSFKPMKHYCECGQLLSLYHFLDCEKHTEKLTFIEGELGEPLKPLLRRIHEADICSEDCDKELLKAATTARNLLKLHFPRASPILVSTDANQ